MSFVKVPAPPSTTVLCINHRLKGLVVERFLSRGAVVLVGWRRLALGLESHRKVSRSKGTLLKISHQNISSCNSNNESWPVSLVPSGLELHVRRLVSLEEVKPTSRVGRLPSGPAIRLESGGLLVSVKKISCEFCVGTGSLTERHGLFVYV